ncbi:MAG: hydroxymethylglutaryl-CoA lyase [Pseudomonadota bacterium]
MKTITITEVGLRDGLQNEREFFPTADKAALANLLIASGVRQLEVSSFVSPKAVPQLADAEALIEQLDKPDDLVLRALVPNERGAERAAGTSVDVWVTFMSATEKHSLANSNASMEKAFERIKPLPQLAAQCNASVCASIAVAFDCPFEGATPVERVVEVAKRFEDIGVTSLVLGDTIGSASPNSVEALVNALQGQLPQLDITLHFHNTRGLALANVMAGIACGVNRYESSVGGIGGCPFAPGATGNVATEDLVHLLIQQDIDCGIDLSALIDAGRYLSTQLNRQLPAHLQHAAPVGEVYEFETFSRAVG